MQGADVKQVFMNWYLKVWKQYADFSGRARRKEYWMFVLFNMIFMFVLGVMTIFITGWGFSGNSAHVSTLIGDFPCDISTLRTVELVHSIVLFLSFGYVLAMIVPSLAVGVRRLHDIGKSGWNYFIGLIPLVGMIILIFWFCQDSEVGKNEWGYTASLEENLPKKKFKKSFYIVSLLFILLLVMIYLLIKSF